MAGLSDGGTVRHLLALRNPTVFTTFASYSGYANPTYLDDDAQQTVTALVRRLPGHLRGPRPGPPPDRGPLSPDWVAGSPPARATPQPLADMEKLAKLAGPTGMQVCLSTPPGDHSFAFWAEAFKDSLPWLSWRLGLTPAPGDVSATCRPPVP